MLGAWWLLYVHPCLTFKPRTFCPHGVLCALYVSNSHYFCLIQYQPVGFLTEMGSAYYEAQTCSLNKTTYVWPLKVKKDLTVITECIVLILHMLEVPGSNPDHYKVFLVSIR